MKATILFGLLLAFALTAQGCSSSNTSGSGNVPIPNVIYVNNEADPDGNGSFNTPFDNLEDAESNSIEGDIIFVYRGDGTSSGLDSGFTMKNNQKLIGEGIGLGFNGFTVVPAGEAPLLDNLTDEATTVVLADNNEIAGVEITSFEGPGIWGSNATAFNIHDNVFTSNNTHGVFLEDVAGTGFIADNVFTTPVDSGVAIQTLNTATDLIATISGNAFTGCGNKCVNIDANLTSDFDMTVSDNIVDASVDDGIQLRSFGDATLHGTVSGNEVTDGGNSGIDLNSQDDSILDMTVDNNLAGGQSGEGILVRAFSTSEMTVTISNSTFDDAGANGMELEVTDTALMTATVSSNAVSNGANFGIFAHPEDDSTMILTLQSNTVTDNITDGMQLRANDTTDLRIDLRSNTLSGNGGASEEFYARSIDSATLCIVETNNTSGGYRLRQQGGSTFNREPATGNTGTVSLAGTITNVAAGTCGF